MQVVRARPRPRTATQERRRIANPSHRFGLCSTTKGGIQKQSELQLDDDAHGEEAIRSARAAGQTTKCIILRDWTSKTILCHVTPSKGLDEDPYTAKIIVEDIVWLGYSAITLKSDNEASILALAAKVMERLRVRVGDSTKVLK